MMDLMPTIVRVAPFHFMALKCRQLPLSILLSIECFSPLCFQDFRELSHFVLERVEKM